MEPPGFDFFEAFVIIPYQADTLDVKHKPVVLGVQSPLGTISNCSVACNATCEAQGTAKNSLGKTGQGAGQKS